MHPLSKVSMRTLLMSAQIILMMNGKIKHYFAELSKLEAEEKLATKAENRTNFWNQNSWKTLRLLGIYPSLKKPKSAVGYLLFDYHYLFAKRGPCISENENLKVKITPENDEPTFTQGPPTPIHCRGEVLEELVLLQYWGVKKLRHIPNSQVLFLL